MSALTLKVLNAAAIANDDEAAYSAAFPTDGFTEILVTASATIALTGGTSPGVKPTLQLDTNGEGNWVDVDTLVATTNGYSANATASAAITATGKQYRFLDEGLGVQGRIKYEVTGTPTGGTATLSLWVALKRGR